MTTSAPQGLEAITSVNTSAIHEGGSVDHAALDAEIAAIVNPALERRANAAKDAPADAPDAPDAPKLEGSDEAASALDVEAQDAVRDKGQDASQVEEPKAAPKKEVERPNAEQFELRKLRRQASERIEKAQALEATLAKREAEAQARVQQADELARVFEDPEAYILNVARRSGRPPEEVLRAMVDRLRGVEPANKVLEPVTREVQELRQQVLEMQQRAAEAQQQAAVANARSAIGEDLRDDLAQANPKFPLLERYDAADVVASAWSIIEAEHKRSGRVLTTSQVFATIHAKLEEDRRRLAPPPAARPERSSSEPSARTEARQPAGKLPSATLTHPNGPSGSVSIHDLDDDGFMAHLNRLVPDRPK